MTKTSGGTAAPGAIDAFLDWQLLARHYPGAVVHVERQGKVLARRTVTIENGELYRIAAPQGVFVRVEDGYRRLDARAVVLAGGQGKAVRPEDMRGALGTGASFAAKEDRHLPEIAALLDPRQFELISRPDAGIVVIQGGVPLFVSDFDPKFAMLFGTGVEFFVREGFALNLMANYHLPFVGDINDFGFVTAGLGFVFF